MFSPHSQAGVIVKYLPRYCKALTGTQGCQLQYPMTKTYHLNYSFKTKYGQKHVDILFLMKKSYKICQMIYQVHREARGMTKMSHSPLSPKTIKPTVISLMCPPISKWVLTLFRIPADKNRHYIHGDSCCCCMNSLPNKWPTMAKFLKFLALYVVWQRVQWSAVKCTLIASYTKMTVHQGTGGVVFSKMGVTATDTSWRHCSPMCA